MTETVKAYHGTGDLQNIIEAGGLYANHNRSKHGDTLWQLSLREYNEITRTIAGEVRRALEEGWLSWRAEYEICADSPDEMLTDAASHQMSSFPFRTSRQGALKYVELRRNLFIFLTKEYDLAKSYSQKENRQAFPGVVELDIPTDIIRPSIYRLDQQRNYLVLGKVGLEHLTAVHVQEPRIRETVELLDAQGLEEVPVRVMK